MLNDDLPGVCLRELAVAAALMIDLVVAAEGARQLGPAEDELEVEALVFFLHLLHDLPVPLVPLRAPVLHTDKQTGIKQFVKVHPVSIRWPASEFGVMARFLLTTFWLVLRRSSSMSTVGMPMARISALRQESS